MTQTIFSMRMKIAVAMAAWRWLSYTTVYTAIICLWLTLYATKGKELLVVDVPQKYDVLIVSGGEFGATSRLR